MALEPYRKLQKKILSGENNGLYRNDCQEGINFSVYSYMRKELKFGQIKCKRILQQQQSELTTKKLSSMFYLKRFLPALRTVHAQDVSKEEKNQREINNGKDRKPDDSSSNKQSDPLNYTQMRSKEIDEMIDMIVSKEDVDEYIAKETPAQRIRDMYTVKGDRVSIDLYYVILTAVAGSLVGGLLGGSMESRLKRVEYMEETRASVFLNRHYANSALRTVALKAGLEGGVRWGCKLGFFIGTTFLVAQTIAAYRNKSSVFEYSIGAGIAGGLTRVSQGLRSMFAASLIGSLMGILPGCFMNVIMIYANQTQEDRHWNITKIKIGLQKLHNGEIPKLPVPKEKQS